MRATALGSAALALAVAVGGAAAARPADGPSRGVVAQTRAFLTAYAAGDRDAVLSQVDPGVVVYGSDAAEVFRGRDGVARMLDDDHKLWRGPAVIGEMQDVSVVASGGLAALTFQAPFTLGARAPVLVRFSMTWRRRAAGWRLVQSANAAPTVGQGAEALLKQSP